MDDFSIFAQYGIAGIVLGILVWLISVCAKERTHLRESFLQAIKEQGEANRLVLQAHTQAMQEMKEVMASTREVLRNCKFNQGKK